MRMSGRRVVFRVDASVQIGIGHVMRCLTLAGALTAAGVTCHFICRVHVGNLIELISKAGHQVHRLSGSDIPRKVACATESGLAHADWLGVSQETDAEQCKSILAQLEPDWLILDHYALDEEWQQILRPWYRKLLVIDDLADRKHGCDLLLDQTLGRSVADYRTLVPEDCDILCGAEYSLLRPEFAALRQYSLARRNRSGLDHLLISMGGVDKDNVTGTVLQALQQSILPTECRVTVVMGPAAPWLDDVLHQAHHMPWPTEVRVGVTNMARLMAESDLAIGAAGSTSWERCCLGLPSIMVVLACNQRQVAMELQKIRAARVLTSSQAITSELPRLLRELLQSAAAMSALSAAAAAVTDGTGTARVLEHME